MNQQNLSRHTKSFSERSAPRPINWLSHALLLFLTIASNVAGALAQAPTSLQYPSPLVLSANVTNASYLPTYSGTVSSFSVSPALPAGMSFNTSSGAITGTPTAASPATNYLVTATNASGTSTFTMNMQVTKNYFNVNYDSLRFVYSPSTITAIRGNGKNVNDSILYKNVAIVEGQAIDCIVRTKELNRVYWFMQYDQEADSGSGYNNNKSRFFSPQLLFDTTLAYATFSFQFILGGSYVNAANPGTPVFLQKVKLNAYDIDGMDALGSNQFYSLSGFDSAELGATTRVATSFDTTSELTKFRSTITANTAALVADSTRARLTYDNMSYFELRVGVDGAYVPDTVYNMAYYSIDFSSGPAFNPAGAPTAGPRIDLNTTLPGMNNATTDCTGQMSFTGGAGQTNALPVGGPTYRQLRVQFRTAQILNGADEQIVVAGATAGGNIALNASTLNSTTTLGGVSYNVTMSTVNGVRSLVFKPASGSMTLANVEALMDALRYANVATTPTNGDRAFTVTLRDNVAQSPAAIFTATVRCASIAGNIFRDANALLDNTVNANSIAGQFASNGVYAVLVNTSNVVVSSKGVSAGGAYTFGRVNTGSYNVLTSSANMTIGSTFSTATTPTGFKHTGENLGASTGNDGLVNGKLPITIGSVSVTQANLGLQAPPTTTNSTFNNLRNPAGFNVIPLAGKLNITEADGTIDSITITAYPSNTNFLKVGTKYYHNGGTRPQQVAVANWVTFPGSGVKVHYSMLSEMGVDPNATGSDMIAFPFKAMDNARMWSNNGSTSTVTLNFNAITNRRVNGYIWHDVNGDGKRKNHEPYLNLSAPSHQLYALLVQTTNTYSGAPTLYAITAVNASASGYEFDNVAEGNDYEVRYTSLNGTPPVPGVALSSITLNPGTGWTCVTTTYKNDTVSYAPAGTTTPVIYIDSLIGNADKLNFGMEKTPTADPKSFTAPASAFTTAPYTVNGTPTTQISANSTALMGSSLKSLSGTDPEDCATSSSCNTGKTFVIEDINSNTLLAYNYGSGPVLIAEETPIENFNVSNLTIIGLAGQGATTSSALGFTYSLADSSGVESEPVSYQLMTNDAPLSVGLERFEGVISNCTAMLSWKVATESGVEEYVLEHSTDGKRFTAVATLACCQDGGLYSTEVRNLLDENYFRVAMVSRDGSTNYSHTITLDAPECGGAQINVWPNPVYDGRLNISGLNGQSNTIRIFNAAGVMVHSTTTDLANEVVTTTALPSGTYLVQISNAGGTILKMVRVAKL